MKMGTIKMVTDYEGNAKHEVLIDKVVTYDENYIEVGRSARLIYNLKVDGEDKCSVCTTSTVQDIHEDSYGLTLYTKNSIIYIEK